MRVVIALGGNALARRGEPVDTDTQRGRLRAAGAALAEVAREHETLVTHGNGPQVGLLALQAEAHDPDRPVPLDVLGAESEGMLGYLLEQELGNRLPGRRIAGLLTQVVVDPGDPAFATPRKPIGPTYPRARAERLARERGWTVARDGEAWRRVVPSPEPQRIVELETIRLLLEAGVLVVCAGGGGIPVAEAPHGRLVGVEAVVDKDLAAALLARELGADALLLLTDVAAVYADWPGTAAPLAQPTPEALRRLACDPGSMGPKVEAACRFAESGAGFAGIGRLEDASALLAGAAGTRVVAAAAPAELPRIAPPGARPGPARPGSAPGAAATTPRPGAPSPLAARDRRVRRILLLEGSANLAVLLAKTVVGLATGSMAVLGDAVHSLADLANNGLALFVIRLASAPPDREHPYGHRKFETLAVFGLATLLAVLAIELAQRAFRDEAREVVDPGWGLAVMLGVLGVNVSVSVWEARWARRLDSDLLRADARHTLSDVLVTCAVIAGWQLGARGWTSLDSLATLLVATLILYLAWGLFRRSIPVLTDRMAADPDELAALVRSVPGVREVRRVRSLGAGAAARMDVVVSVDPRLSTAESHTIADAVERRLRERHGVGDVTVHVEPGNPGESGVRARSAGAGSDRRQGRGESP